MSNPLYSTRSYVSVLMLYCYSICTWGVGGGGGVWYNIIGHFRVAFCSASNWVRVANFHIEISFYSHVHFHANQTHFHLNGFAPGLDLKQRQKTTWKWPTDLACLPVHVHLDCLVSVRWLLYIQYSGTHKKELPTFVVPTSIEVPLTS